MALVCSVFQILIACQVVVIEVSRCTQVAVVAIAPDVKPSRSFSRRS